jgi:hypothetical protein
MNPEMLQVKSYSPLPLFVLSFCSYLAREHVWKSEIWNLLHFLQLFPCISFAVIHIFGSSWAMYVRLQWILHPPSFLLNFKYATDCSRLQVKTSCFVYLKYNEEGEFYSVSRWLILNSLDYMLWNRVTYITNMSSW